MEYFLFELNDYALPGFASGTSLYLGTKSDFRNLLRNNDRVEKNLKETFKGFCAGNRTIKYYVAYAEKRFAYPVKLICRKKIKLDANVYEHINIWGFPYNVHTDFTELTIALIKFQGKYYIYFRANVENPRLEGDGLELGDNCWGFPGMLKHSVKDGQRFLGNTLMIYNATFNEEKEALVYFSSLKNVDMKYFYNEVFGDG